MLSNLSKLAFSTPFMEPFRAAHGATLLSEFQVQNHCFNPLRTWQYQVSLSHRDTKKRIQIEGSELVSRNVNPYYIEHVDTIARKI